ncbi:hypothetical protein Loa_02039 [Legionella oakridgensis ATCC 33761 = DSM 21215]|uniref:Uncharacterized protein n=2 Tax=Legionella oakridgensis TaxID=29423 RepID=W0BAL3_9GAMM|nr:hypothetical protein Loa_02039 [Legionella oakridgensis ATCC 33761 = DSM 21215]KTD37068.1 hypothetical protein Loak_2204 [Legionella oakridgensis]STY20623.1 Uncharacterised protein [Legionella longbeachae]
MPKPGEDEEDRESAAARRIQKTVRGIAARSGYKITRLTDEEASDYVPFFSETTRLLLADNLRSIH